MYKIRVLELLLYIFVITVYCECSNENIKSKKIIPYFRRQVEEIEDKNLLETIDKDDPHNNLVSFIVNNVKEIFDDVIDKPEIRPITTNDTITSSDPIEFATTIVLPTLTYEPSPLMFRTIVNDTEGDIHSSTTALKHPTRTNVILYENLTLSTLVDNTETMPGLYGINTKSTLKHKPFSIDTSFIGKPDKKGREVNVMARAFPSSIYALNLSETDIEQDPRRSCIMCNNVATEECNDPKNKLIQSVVCEREDDMCYSMHTPFGIIDRGCFNSNHNLTTYVCSCNLCNHISISDMPYMFNKKRDWVDNVIDISRTRHFRNSVFKDMSCLKCEVNTTQQQGDILDTANCLEGHVGNIPVVQCEQNEVCGVKALRADGYIWRGCIKAPLYNYWWMLCDFDLCNFDSIISLYDLV